mmetsp:Transcript_1241/g.2006  ORF Transcript_1241/g.2006 Transcript_1241/m.2006 type:complete len:369 (-) Transcript_1241:50-1156(-)
MSGPKDYKQCRENNDTSPLTVDGRPYLPNLKADDARSSESIAQIAATVVNQELSPDQLTVAKVTGGITNALFRVSGFAHERFDSVLVRVFGAEGMIDRDLETCTFAALCDAKIAPGYLGRFGNGRVESWLNDYVPLEFDELSDPDTSRKIASKMAEVHAFEIKGDLCDYYSEPGMWDQLFSWMKQAKGSKFHTPEDEARAVALNLSDIEEQLHYLKNNVVPSEARAAFCHNDLLAANIMKQSVEPFAIQLIDFEYGGWNYVGFDIANHFNEWAGGTDNGKPEYSKFPTKDQQRRFVEAYVEALSTGNEEVTDDIVQNLLDEVHAFVLANHLYWGLWAVNQASAEGCEEFDYLLYAANRFQQYRVESKK